MNSFNYYIQQPYLNYFTTFTIAFIFTYILLAVVGFIVLYKFTPSFLKNKKIQQVPPQRSAIQSDIIWSITSMVIWIGVTYILFLLISRDLTKVYLNISQYGLIYWTFTGVLFIIIHDTYYYWVHRFMHLNRFMFKYVHSHHHTSRTPTPLSMFAFGPIEALLLGGYFILMTMFIPVHIYIIVLVFAFNSLANFIGHSGYEITKSNNHTGWKKYILNSIHHDDHHKYAYMNYGIYFTFWDTCMNTMHPLYHKDEEIFYFRQIDTKLQ
jgi:sterol desaturase/sphingolipid hydroxylase (fatty acid hydroxylase superfamily)